MTRESNHETATAAPDLDPRWRHYGPLDLGDLLSGALEVFAEVGYHGASIRTIAERAGTSVAGLYYHHPSKNHLLTAILDLTMQDLLARRRGALAEGRTTVERFSNVVESLTLFHTHRRVLGFIGSSETRSMTGDGARLLHDRRVEQQDMVDREIARGIEEGVFSTASAPDAGRAVTSLCTSVCIWYRPGGTHSAEEVAREYVGYSLGIVGHRS